MEIILTNVAEAGMPESIAGHCRILLERRIQKLFPGALPGLGADVTILYSEKDPLWERLESDDSAYFVHFSVEEVEGNGAEARVFVRLEF